MHLGARRKVLAATPVDARAIVLAEPRPTALGVRGGGDGERSSTASLSSTVESNFRMIGAAMPTSPSAMFTTTPTFSVGASVVNEPSILRLTRSRPVALPAQVYFAPYQQTLTVNVFRSSDSHAGDRVSRGIDQFYVGVERTTADDTENFSVGLGGAASSSGEKLTATVG